MCSADRSSFISPLAKQSAHPPSGSSSNQKAREKRRKKESQTHLVQDTPIRKTLGCTCVELRDLVSGGDQVHWLCDLGVQEQSGRVTAPQDKETSKKSKDDKKKEDKKAKPVGESTAPQRNSPSSKSRNRGRKESEMERRAESAQRGPLTVELSIRLHKWQTAA
ncbi:hypothetical protein JZ751_012999 [Albula glossodonta]|uniref:Uncharacterized protein n=1 Tax=Albula glossodonta TaxID=121402 RepID=A0A8T2N5Z3_9TELE|nr:hypothetical protein JZ751_012999 [Albula glossodonta]